MHWFSKQDASPQMAALAVMGITRSALAHCLNSDESRRLIQAIDDAKSHLSSVEKAAALAIVLDEESLRLPSGALLKKRPDAVSLSLRALDCVCRALRQGDDAVDQLQSWKLIASASLSAGIALVAAHNTSKAVKAARSQHAEDYQSRADVVEWLEKNSGHYRSMDAMSRAIEEEKLVPYKLSTIRTWVGQWKHRRA